MLRRTIKSLSVRFLVPLVRWYLRKERSYSYNDSSIRVAPGVFHPGLFYSTRFLLEYLATQQFRNQSMLELGCGTGLISIECARRGARVTSVDLNATAVKNCCENAKENNVAITVFQSDLFDSIPPTRFDWIVINPPYYAKPARTDEELAWNCGSEFQYFRKLFLQLPDFVTKKSTVIMVLTKGCDLNAIKDIANESGFTFKLLKEKKVFFDEKDYLFRIRSTQLSYSEL